MKDGHEVKDRHRLTTPAREMEIIISNRQDRVRVDGRLAALMRRTISELLTAEGIPSGAEVSLTLVDDETMAKYNRQYRKVDGTTDVLSFPLLDQGPASGPAAWFGIPPAGMAGLPPVLLGDIVISVEYAQREADRRGRGLDAELVRLIVHGFLHLLGHDHGTDEEQAAMVERERTFVQRMGMLWEDGP